MTEQAGPESRGPAAFGRVDDDGTVYVRTSAGERAVGQVPGVPADEALGFFTRRFESLELEVSLLERRIATGAVSPDDAVASINKLRKALADARAVGDLEGLQSRLEALSPVIADQRAARRRNEPVSRRRLESQRRGSSSRQSVSPPGTIGAAGSTGFACFWRNGRRCHDLIGQPTTLCGTDFPVPALPTHDGGRRSSRNRTNSAKLPG
jgi:hypothetical protein